MHRGQNQERAGQGKVDGLPDRVSEDASSDSRAIAPGRLSQTRGGGRGGVLYIPQQPILVDSICVMQKCVLRVRHSFIDIQTEHPDTYDSPAHDHVVACIGPRPHYKSTCSPRTCNIIASLASAVT